MSGGGHAAVPTGYIRLALPQGTLVALEPCAEMLRNAMGRGTLYEFAAQQPLAHPLLGRGVAYAVAVPGDCGEVVVRRSRHGGAFAPLLGDIFWGPPRAAHELDTALRLEAMGIPTPQVAAYATYPVAPLLVRTDVVTRRVPRAHDLAELLTSREDEESRTLLFAAVAALVARMTENGVHHPDLNLKNILLSRSEGNEWEAVVIDVDRVLFEPPGAATVTEANITRLERSARKWRDRWGMALSETELTSLRAQVDALLRSGATSGG